MTYTPTADETFALQCALGRLHATFPEEELKERPVADLDFEKMEEVAACVMRKAMEEHDILAGWGVGVRITALGGDVRIHADFRPPVQITKIEVRSAMTGRIREIPVKRERNG